MMPSPSQQPQQLSAQQQHSPFLRCLNALGDDVLTQVLVPKLVDNGSAAAAALTCTRLRQVCQAAVTVLGIGDTYRDRWRSTPYLRQYVQSLGQRFPCCTEVQLRLTEKSYSHLMFFVKALAGFPRLSHLELEIHKTMCTLFTAQALSSMRLQLGGLRHLSLHVQHTWVSDADCSIPGCWERLGEFTQLETLHMSFECRSVWSEFPFDLQDLRHLGSLVQLQELELRVDHEAARLLGEQVQSRSWPSEQFFSWLSSLTTLTSLVVNLFGTPLNAGLAGVSHCKQLQRLGLPGAELGQQQWAAIGLLQHLTRLDCGRGSDWQRLSECREAMAQLTTLQQVSAETWVPEVLPVFQQLTGLTSIGGEWAGEEAAVGDATCPHVVVLEGIGGCVPFQAFPNLQRVQQQWALECASFECISRSCTKLRSLTVRDPATAGTSLPWLKPRDAAMRAVMSLSALVGLTELYFQPTCRREVAALGAAATALTALEQLTVVLCQDSEMSFDALLLLSRLTQLRQLNVVIDDTQVLQHVAVEVLMSLSGVPRVELLCWSTDQSRAFKAAAQECVDVGLPRPEHVVAGTFSP